MACTSYGVSTEKHITRKQTEVWLTGQVFSKNKALAFTFHHKQTEKKMVKSVCYATGKCIKKYGKKLIYQQGYINMLVRCITCFMGTE